MSQPLPTTEFASKYGTYMQTNRSGLTPIQRVPTFGPNLALHIENYQRGKLYGFTSEELERLDCLPTRELRPGTLQNPILSLMDRDAWETGPLPEFVRDYMYPLDDGIGVWEASNDEVWNAIRPCLVLASRILMSVYMLPWFDALIHGPRRLIDDERKNINDMPKADYDNIMSFHIPGDYSDARVAQVVADRETIFDKLQNLLKLQWGFMDAEQEDPEDPSKPAPVCYGLTRHNQDYMESSDDPARSWRLFIWLDIEMIGPLMRSDINSADRMMLHWHVANVMVHELMHAIQDALPLPNATPDYTDPYFELEPVSEIGFSFESAINYGATAPFVTDPAVLAMGWWHRKMWPTIKDAVQIGEGKDIILQNPGPALEDEFYPIPMSAFEDMQREDFWVIHIRRFGHGALHYRNVNQGAKVVYTQPTNGGGELNRAITRLMGSNYSIENQEFRSQFTNLQLAVAMTQADRQAIRFAQTFIIGSQAEAEFWTESQTQVIRTNQMLTTIQAILNQQNTRPEDRLSRMNEVLNLVKQGIEHHGMMWAAIVSSESANGVQYPNRRKTLLAWNCGTRSFVNQILLFQLPADLAQGFQYCLLRLERVRMALWVHGDIPNGLDTDLQELQMIAAAMDLARQGQLTQCMNILNSLPRRVRPTVTITTTITVTMIAFEVLQGQAQDWQSRKQGTMMALKNLDWLLERAPNTWRAHLAMLKQEGDRLMALSEPASSAAGGPAPAALPPI